MFNIKFSYLIFLITIIFMCFDSLAQSNIFEKCGFDHKHNIYLQDTGYQKLIQLSEQRVASYLNTPKTSKNKIDNEINISGYIKFKLFIIF